MSFKEESTKNILETIMVLKQSIDIIDNNKPARAGALLGSQAMVLTQFLQNNKKDKVVLKTIKEMEKMMKKEKDKRKAAMKKLNIKEGLTYVG